MAELKGSQTEKNLLAAFAGESQAFTKYNYYASKAKKDGYVQIGKLFEETANNEKEHAKIWFKLLHGGVMPETTENLKSARQYRGRLRLFQGRRCHLGMCQLRSHCRRQKGSGGLSGLPAPAVLFSGQG